jgi:hypothetical protein
MLPAGFPARFLGEPGAELRPGFTLAIGSYSSCSRSSARPRTLQWIVLAWFGHSRIKC